MQSPCTKENRRPSSPAPALILKLRGDGRVTAFFVAGSDEEELDLLAAVRDLLVTGALAALIEPR